MEHIFERKADAHANLSTYWYCQEIIAKDNTEEDRLHFIVLRQMVSSDGLEKAKA